MRLENQVQSLHYFNAYAALSHVETLHLDDTKPIGDIKDLPVSTFFIVTRRLFSAQKQLCCAHCSHTHTALAFPGAL